MIKIIHQSKNADKLYRNLWDFNPVDKIIQYNGEDMDVQETIYKAIQSDTLDVFMVVDDNHIPIAYYGVTPLRRGVAELWLIRGVDFKLYPFQIIRATEDFVAYLFKNGIFRLEVAVLPKWERWAKAIGFEFEHTCKKYDGITDHKVFTRLR